jgi:hypothetical protein
MAPKDYGILIVLGVFLAVALFLRLGMGAGAVLPGRL